MWTLMNCPVMLERLAEVGGLLQKTLLIVMSDVAEFFFSFLVICSDGWFHRSLLLYGVLDLVLVNALSGVHIVEVRRPLLR